MSDDMAAFGFCALPPTAERLRRMAGALGPGGPARHGLPRARAHPSEPRVDAGENAVEATVAGRPLLDMVRKAGISRLDPPKIDVEGMELPVLRHYLAHVQRALWARIVVLEAHRREETPALAHLRALGYGVKERTRVDAALRLPADATDRIGVTGNAHGHQA